MLPGNIKSRQETHLKALPKDSVQTWIVLLSLEQYNLKDLNFSAGKTQIMATPSRTYGPVGVLVRMGDKLARLQSITKKEVRLVDSESTRDTLIDLHNYAAMAIMLLDEDFSR